MWKEFMPRINTIYMDQISEHHSDLTNSASSRFIPEMITAEPAYILLAAYNHPDAHEYVRELTLESQKTGKPFRELLFKDEKLKPYLDKFSKKQVDILKNPENYIGIAGK